MMEKGLSHGLPPEGALRIKWMRMMAKCKKTEANESHPPRPIRMGRSSAGGGHRHPKAGDMAKRMEDEQNLITRRGVAWCKRTPATTHVPQYMPRVTAPSHTHTPTATSHAHVQTTTYPQLHAWEKRGVPGNWPHR